MSVFSPGERISLTDLFLRLVFAYCAKWEPGRPHLAYMFPAAGASGTKPCPKCLNVVSFRSDLASGSELLVTLAETRMDKLVPATSATIFESYDRLATYCGSKKGFDQLEKRLGWSWHPRCVLADTSLRPRLRPVDTMWMDPLHTFVADGVMSQELALLCMRMAEQTQQGLGWRSLATFCVQEVAWHYGSDSSGRSAWFSERRIAASIAAQSYKGPASAVLSFFMVVAHFVETVLLPKRQLAPAAESYLALAYVVFLVFLPGCVHHRIRNSADALSAAVCRHLALWRLAYPNSRARPKHHQTMHMAQQAKYASLMNCFTLERKHQDYKDLADLVPVGSGWKLAVTQRLAQATLAGLASYDDAAVAVNNPSALAEGHEVLALLRGCGLDVCSASASLRACVHGLHVVRNDALVIASPRGERYLLADIFVVAQPGPRLLIVGRPGSVESTARCSQVWRFDEGLAWAELEHVVMKCCWTKVSAHRIVACRWSEV